MKKKIWKKVLALGLAGVLSLGVLSGCGGSGSGSSGDSGSSASSEGGELDTSEEVELVMYVVSDRPANQDEVDAAINEILKEKLNCTLKINWIGWAEYANKYPLLFSSGEEFDIAYCATWLNFQNLAMKGAFMELDSLWEQYAPDNFAMQSDMAKLEATVDGHYYCVPTLMSTYNAYGVTYRTDILEGTEWDGREIASLEDLEYYCDLVKANSDITPLDMYQTGSEFYQYGYMPQQNYTTLDKSTTFLYFNYDDENPTVIAPYQYDGTKDFLNMMVTWNEKGFFSKNALADTDSTQTDNGKAAAKFHNIDTYSSLAGNHPDWGFKFGLLTKSVAHLPYTQDCMVISNTAKNPERALAFWNLLTTDRELFDTFYYGIKDVSYTLDEEGRFQITDPDLYATNAMWAARTDEFNRDGITAPDDYQTYKDGFESTIKEGEGNEKFSAFTFDTSPVETEFANCKNVWSQYWMPMELGYNTNGVDGGLAEFQEKMEAAGIDKVIAEAQTQLDAYLANMQ